MEITLQLPNETQRVLATGPAERNLKLLREALGVRITAREGALRLGGERLAVAQAQQVLEKLLTAARHGQPVSHAAVLEMLAEAGRNLGHTVPGPSNGVAHPDSDPSLEVFAHNRRIRPKTEGQKAYLKAILAHDLTFCAGPAGSGKTYLAVAAAVDMLRRGEVRKLVLVRPAVEAGEKLGFLPGTMQEKVNPYLRPLLDALHDMMEFDRIERFMASDLIEIIPLAFMRGRTLNDACILLDEAQNTTRAQMLMFLTRLGHGSKMIVTGDTSQTDLDDPRESGLVDAARRLRHTRGVALVALSGTDIVRHSLVQRIVEAYGGENRTAARLAEEAPAHRPQEQAAVPARPPEKSPDI